MASWKANLTVAALAAGALFTAGTAHAQVACNTLPNPIFLEGSSASQALWNQIGPVLSADNTSLVLYFPGSCNGVTAIEDAQTNGTPDTITATSAVYWFPDGGFTTCTDNGDPVDVGVSDVFRSTCDIVNPAGTAAPMIGAFNAPTQVMTFLRPIDGANSLMPNEISAEQAHFVLAGPAGDGIAPWNQPTENVTASDAGTPYLFLRNETSGTQSMIAQSILLAPGTFQGVDAKKTGVVIADVVAAAGTLHDEAVMGIAAAGGGYDSNRGSAQALAYRGYQQAAAWLPDSTVASFDKANVRAGLYTIFGPLQILYTIDPTTGAATDSKATTLLNYLNGTVPLPGTTTSITQYEIAAAMIPDCAMGVTRADINYSSTDFPPNGATLGGNTEGAIVPSNRAHSCDCYFESQVPSAPNNHCKTCTGPSDCPNAVCGSNGVCEAF